MIPFNYHHLYYFYTIASLGSVSKAAEKLRVGQPALSSQLKQFEHYLGFKLFDRENKKLKLTEHGRWMLGYAAQIFSLGQEMSDSLSDKAGPNKRLRIQIGVSDFIPKSYTEALCKFILKHAPSTFISIQEKDPDRMLEELDTHLLDMILTDKPHRSGNSPEIQSYSVGKIPIVFCGTHLFVKQIKKLADLGDMPIILPTSDSQLHHAVLDFFIQHKLSPTVVAEIQDVEIMRRLVLANVGIAPVNAYTVKTAPSHEKMRVVRVRMPGMIYDSPYLLIKKRQRPHPLTDTIIQNFRLDA